MLLDFDPSDLIKSKDYVLRKAVANNGQCLEKLIDDKDFRVRVAVAHQGYGLDRLIHDEKKRSSYRCC